MNRSLLIAYYRKRGFNDEVTESATRAVERLEHEAGISKGGLEEIPLAEVRKYMKNLVGQKISTLEGTLALARYFFLINRQDIYIYFTSLLGGLGVLENIIERAKQFVEEQKITELFDDFVMPQIGLEPTELQHFTNIFMNLLEQNLPLDTVKKILAGNNHGVSRDVFLKERELFMNSESIDAYLLDYHNRKVQELQNYCDQKKVWYEQVITQEVVDYVKQNQEIMSAVRKDDKLYLTKIPYNPARYLQEQDPNMKRYYACHCPFAREAILEENTYISSNWCYCSGGFTKFPYEVIFDQPLNVELLQSVLKGDDVCRFAIQLPLL